jgi:ribosomal protein S6--L-glutamate ligase
MMPDLHAVRVGLIERRHPPGHQGSLAQMLVPCLQSLGAHVDVVHADEGAHLLTDRPAWNIALLKSGSAAALHLAAAAKGWGVPCINSGDATKLTQDKLASSAILQAAGLPIAKSRIAWLGGTNPSTAIAAQELTALDGQPLIIKAARGSQGKGLWNVAPGQLSEVLPHLPAGPYLIMDWVAHTGHDLKVFAAGEWMTAIERPFPARTLTEKRGRLVALPDEVACHARAAGRLLGLSCYGCDFVAGEHGWTLVDVNAFPGYKGADDAPMAIAAEIHRVLTKGFAR